MRDQKPLKNLDFWTRKYIYILRVGINPKWN